MASKEIWAFLFLLGLTVFNWPFLSIFGSALPYALYGMWAALILAIAVFSAIEGRQDS